MLSDREVLLPEDLPAAVLRGGDAPETLRRDLDLDSVAKWILDHAAYSVRVPLMPALEKALARQLVAKRGRRRWRRGCWGSASRRSTPACATSRPGDSALASATGAGTSPFQTGFFI